MSGKIVVGVLAGVLAVTGVSNAALWDYEGFDYALGDDPVLLAGQTGGTGWGGAWINSAESYEVVSGSLISAASPFTPIGARVSATGAAARPLSQGVDLSQDGNVVYVSGLMRKNGDNVSGSNVEIDLTTASTTQQAARFGVTSGGAFFLNSSSNIAGAVVSGMTYFMVGKIVSSAASPDQVFMSIYEPTDTVPVSEPGAWLLSSEVSASYSAATLQNVRVAVGNNTLGDFDEIRIGSTWESVAVPEPASLVILLGMVGLGSLSARRRK